jgi:hypothetical protein
MNSEEFDAAFGTIPGWRKSSYSGADGCVDVNNSIPGRGFIRDSKIKIGSPVLAFDSGQMRAFLLRTKRGEFDTPSG